MSLDCEGFCSGQDGYLLLLLHVGKEILDFFANLRGFPWLPSMCCSTCAIRIWYFCMCFMNTPSSLTTSHTQLAVWRIPEPKVGHLPESRNYLTKAWVITFSVCRYLYGVSLMGYGNLTYYEDSKWRRDSSFISVCYLGTTDLGTLYFKDAALSVPLATLVPGCW